MIRTVKAPAKSTRWRYRGDFTCCLRNRLKHDYLISVKKLSNHIMKEKLDCELHNYHTMISYTKLLNSFNASDKLKQNCQMRHFVDKDSRCAPSWQKRETGTEVDCV